MDSVRDGCTLRLLLLPTRHDVLVHVSGVQTPTFNVVNKPGSNVSASIHILTLTHIHTMRLLLLSTRYDVLVHVSGVQTPTFNVVNKPGSNVSASILHTHNHIYTHNAAVVDARAHELCSDTSGHDPCNKPGTRFLFSLTP